MQEIARELIAVARKNMPKAHEFIYHDGVGYSVNDSSFDRICYISPQNKGYVNFGFFFGASLPDPGKLLIGTGKRMRHVKIKSVGMQRSLHWQAFLPPRGGKPLDRSRKCTLGGRKVKVKELEFRVQNEVGP